MLNKKNIVRVWKWADFKQRATLEKDFPWIMKEGWSLDENDIEDDETPEEEPELEERHLSLHEQQEIMANQRREDLYKDGE